MTGGVSPGTLIRGSPALHFRVTGRGPVRRADAGPHQPPKLPECCPRLAAAHARQQADSMAAECSRVLSASSSRRRRHPLVERRTPRLFLRAAQARKLHRLGATSSHQGTPRPQVTQLLERLLGATKASARPAAENMPRWTSAVALRAAAPCTGEHRRSSSVGRTCDELAARYRSIRGERMKSLQPRSSSAEHGRWGGVLQTVHRATQRALRTRSGPTAT